MAFDAHKNFAYGTVATAPSPATSGTSLVVQSGEGAAFPTPPFNATVWPTGVQPLDVNAEIVRVTGVSTDTFTIVRSQEGSSARSIVVGDQIANTITTKVVTDIEALAHRPAFSYVVAASDTPAELQALADAVCDGTSDEVEINAAISAVAGVSARVLLLPGTYNLGDQIDFSPLAVSGSVEDGMWVDFDATSATLIATANMATMVYLAAPSGHQVFSKLNVRIGRIDGNKASFTVGQGVYMQRFVDNKVWIGELVNCSSTGFFADQNGVTDHGCFNNIIEIVKLNTNGGGSSGQGFYASSDPDGTSIFGFQCNIVKVGQAHGNYQGFVIGDAADENAFINRFEIGVVEHSTAYGIYDKCGQNMWIVGNTNNNTTKGIITSSSMTKKSTFILGEVTDSLDSTVTGQHLILDAGAFAGFAEFAEQGSAPGTPASGFGRLYEKTDGKVYFKNHAGTEYDLTVAAFTAPLTTKGDLFGFSTVNARIPVGTNGQVLLADSTQTLGLKWGSIDGGSA